MGKKKKIRVKRKKIKIISGDEYKYKGYSYTKRDLNNRKKAYKKLGYKVRTFKEKTSSGKTIYEIYLKKVHFYVYEVKGRVKKD